jgi:ammonium transporter, Amt family
MVLLMQVGFAFLEAGCVRYRNLQSIIIKIFLNTSVGVVLWWIVRKFKNMKIGYGIAFGVTHTPFVGQSNFVGENYDKSPRFHDWVF